MTVEDIIRAMVGRDISTLFPKTPGSPGTEVLRVERLTREGVFTDVSFNVRAGEIVALSGLMGAGRSEVARAIFGIDRPRRRPGFLNGRHPPRIAHFVDGEPGWPSSPEDRRQQGLVMSMAIDHNIALASLSRLSTRRIIRRSAEARLASDWSIRLGSSTAD